MKETNKRRYFMKKRWLLGVVQTICVTAAVMALIMGPHSAFAQTAAKPLTLSLSFWGPMEEPMAKALQEYAAEIEKNTGERVKITIYPGGSLTSGAQAYEGVVAGLSSMAFVNYGFTPGRLPLAQGWTLPFYIANTRAATQIFNECVEKFKPKEFADTKLMYLTSCTEPVTFLAKKEIKTINDFKGLRIRVLGILAVYLKSLGVVPVAMPPTEIYAGLDRGVIDGTMMIPLTLDTWKLADVVKYMFDWEWGPSNAWGLHMNWNVWNSLPPDIRKVFEEANKKYMWKQVEYQDAADQKGLEVGKAKGMKILEPSPELKKDLRKFVQPAYDQFVADMKAKNLPGKEFLDFILKRAEEVK
jgi:TRAP-type C4-dicarboxylate transport system substrate-binding protein